MYNLMYNVQGNKKRKIWSSIEFGPGIQISLVVRDKSTCGGPSLCDNKKAQKGV